ncbi:Fibronectin type III domain-containing protein [Halorientalis persicus]|uniref:Fibronectin type III domain-containing protein n=1 Tax=Halorientalis persicus TaxID=1367881 RepID=A0A1H8S0I2_9EURY|nr:fibronectin type III domain-containing protein [Halorientalis persicus]SEO71954.1 Fibronectin type III domain-containing protein [Halorientalis persicus]
MATVEGTTVSRPQDENSRDAYEGGGNIFNPNTDLAGIKLKLSSKTLNIETIELWTADADDYPDTKLTEKNNSNLWDSGETISITESLTAGQKYVVYAVPKDGFGNDYIGTADVDPSPWSRSSTDVDWGPGYTEIDGPDDLLAYAFIELTALLSVSAPSTPQNLTASASQDDITLNWDSVDWGEQQDHYNIYRGQSSGSYSYIAEVPAGTTSYTDSGLLDGERYYYVVDAENSAGTSGDSNETVATTALPAPSNLSLSN